MTSPTLPGNRRRTRPDQHACADFTQHAHRDGRDDYDDCPVVEISRGVERDDQVGRVRAVGRRAAAGGFASLGAPGSKQRVRRAGRAVPRRSVTRSLPGCRPMKRAESTARWPRRWWQDAPTIRKRSSNTTTAPASTCGPRSRRRSRQEGQRGAGVRSRGLLYRRALDLAPDAADALVWKQGLASALANAGRPADAGRSISTPPADAEPVQRSSCSGVRRNNS